MDASQITVNVASSSLGHGLPILFQAARIQPPPENNDNNVFRAAANFKTVTYERSIELFEYRIGLTRKSSSPKLASFLRWWVEDTNSKESVARGKCALEKVMPTQC
jgi:hypothetical protein